MYQTIRKPLKDFGKKQRFLSRAGIKHKIVYTNSSIKIVTGNTATLYSESDVPQKELNFIGDVIKHFDTLPEYTPEMIDRGMNYKYTNRDIQYFQFYGRPSDTDYTIHEGRAQRIIFETPDATEIDLSEAYWRAADTLGLLSEEIYQKGLKVSKKTRLVALGATAAQRVSIEWDQGQNDYNVLNTPPNDRAHYFFAVCKYIDNIMQAAAHDYHETDIIGEGPILLYWVDCWMIRPDFKNILIDYLDSHGLPWKEKPIYRYMVVLNQYPAKYLVHVYPKAEGGGPVLDENGNEVYKFFNIPITRNRETQAGRTFADLLKKYSKY